MKVGLTLPVLHAVEISQGATRLAESLGLDSVWLSDHLLGITHPDLWPEFAASAVIADPDSWLDPFCVAAILGRETDLMVGSSVTDSVRRRAPDLTRTLLTLNNSCRGGFVLGIGSGEAESTLPFGYDFSKPTAKLEQTLMTIRSLLDTGRMPDGGIGRNGLSAQNPRMQPQVWAAGIGDRSLDLVGKYADGWISMGVAAEDYAQKRDQVRRSAAAAGRPHPVNCVSPVMLLCDSRAHGAAALEAQPLAKLILMFAPATLWKKYGLEHPSGPTCRGAPDTIPHAVDPALLRKAARQIPLEMFEEFVMMGNADHIASRMRPYAEAGADHVNFADMTGLTFSGEETGRLLVDELGRLAKLLQSMQSRSA